MIDLAGPTVFGLRKKIEDDLPAFLTARNAQADVVADGITAPAPVLIASYVPAISLQRAWPLVGIIRQPSRFSDDTGFAMTGNHALTVCTFVQHAEPEVLSKLIDRVTTCVFNAAVDGRRILTEDQASVAAYGVRPVAVRWSDMLAEVFRDDDDPQSWLAWSEIDLVCLTDEDA